MKNTLKLSLVALVVCAQAQAMTQFKANSMAFATRALKAAANHKGSLLVAGTAVLAAYLVDAPVRNAKAVESSSSEKTKLEEAVKTLKDVDTTKMDAAAKANHEAKLSKAEAALKAHKEVKAGKYYFQDKRAAAATAVRGAASTVSAYVTSPYAWVKNRFAAKSAGDKAKDAAGKGGESKDEKGK